MGVSVPTRLEMEISYRFIRNPAKRLYWISFLRIILRVSPSPRGSKWKYLTDLYAILRRDSIEFHFCVQLQEHLRPRDIQNGNNLQIYTQIRRKVLQNRWIAYNSEGVSVPAKLKMGEFYRFIHNPAKRLYRISFLRIILRVSPSLRNSKWK